MNKKLTKFSAIALSTALGLTFIPNLTFANTTITLEKAKEIALKDAGLKESDVNFVKAKLDTRGDNNEYDIEFTNAGKEYDYEIDATSGAIIEKDFEIEKKSKQKQGTTTNSNSSTTKNKTKKTTDSSTNNTNTKANKKSTSTTVDTSKNISLEKAKEIALKDAGLKESDVNFVKAKLDTRGGDNEYDIEFTNAGKEYDYEIDAVSGSILEKDNTIEKKSKNSSTRKQTNTNSSKTKTEQTKNQTTTTTK